MPVCRCATEDCGFRKYLQLGVPAKRCVCVDMETRCCYCAGLIGLSLVSGGGGGSDLVWGKAHFVFTPVAIVLSRRRKPVFDTAILSFSCSRFVVRKADKMFIVATRKKMMMN